MEIVAPYRESFWKEPNNKAANDAQTEQEQHTAPSSPIAVSKGDSSNTGGTCRELLQREVSSKNTHDSSTQPSDSY